MRLRRPAVSDWRFSFWYFASSGTPIWDFLLLFGANPDFVLTFS
jgi:hypothetical protein